MITKFLIEDISLIAVLNVHYGIEIGHLEFIPVG
ncbi:MAG: hypothetical protein K0Q59_3712, partial [Paenibacillus sp.]|nr:hypothetical protein [Paenibacillus sp.]